MPALSVVIPARNAASFLHEALDSVFAQGIGGMEVVVVDDGSTDGTWEAASAYGRGVRAVRQEASGSARARNRGLAETTGDLVAFLDADDVWLPDKTRRQLEVLEADPRLVLVFSDMVAFRGDVTEPTTYFRQRGFDGRCAASSIFLYDMISTPTVIVRRDGLRRAGGFDESLPIGQDTDLWFRLALAHPFAVVDRPLVRRRFHGANVTRDARLLARCVARIWGRYLDACIEREPSMRARLVADYARKRWTHHFEEGCSLLREGRPREARRELAAAVAAVPGRWRAYAFWLASFARTRGARGEDEGRWPAL
ncbi:MAG TPA: glycosyltransferase [Candidatus Polarisedimenticolia bacterium]|nr:glycosyltransferase [Candidatus Polarisedimenticolia bacterium]